MLSLLHGAVVGDAEKLRQEILTNQPFRHVVIEPFLNPELCGQLIAECPVFDGDRTSTINAGA